MKKATAIVCGAALGIGLFAALLGATGPTTDDSAKLDEIKSLLSESLRIQKADVHRRNFPNHRVGSQCDYAEKCIGLDSFAKAHARAWDHPWTEDCGAGKCNAKEETYKKNLERER